MALFMDIHSIEGGVSADDVAGAHAADLATQDKYGANHSSIGVATMKAITIGTNRYDFGGTPSVRSAST